MNTRGLTHSPPRFSPHTPCAVHHVLCNLLRTLSLVSWAPYLCVHCAPRAEANPPPSDPHLARQARRPDLALADSTALLGTAAAASVAMSKAVGKEKQAVVAGLMAPSVSAPRDLGHALFGAASQLGCVWMLWVMLVLY